MGKVIRNLLEAEVEREMVEGGRQKYKILPQDDKYAQKKNFMTKMKENRIWLFDEEIKEGAIFY